MVSRNKLMPILLVVCASVHRVSAQASNVTTSSSNCQPANCPMVCSPSCSSDQVCTKKSMTDCGICPALLCMSRTALGLPPPATSSNVSSSADQGSSNETGVLVGGILGGLVGFGILVGIGIYCYIKKNKRGKLPFAFTSGNASHIVQSQEKFHQSQLQSPQQVTPHPAVIAALSHQSTITTTSSSSRYIGLANLANGGNLQRQTSMTSTSNHTIQTPLYNADTPTNTTSNNTNISNTVITGNVPEEFESKIALQNKRISEILYNNPRLSQQPQPQPRPHIQHAQQRYSTYTTTDDDFDDGDDRKSTLSTSTTQSDYLPQTATATSLQAVQIARAKPQIMRVNSVKSTSGLNRSESVRTVLTAIEDIQNFPSTPTRNEMPATTAPSATTAKATSTHEDNPFADKHTDNITH
ncbi:3'-phosphoadenosine 5'-phosphosulfate sulfotransferase [Mucor velutinosus]|uniref:3'-phosphoadenosine 5'-phosphosulfate sulfotransferase n=1 Tax=Mucor velutinosus TaxID=708070 RepID=A0AAN7HWW1_9FUNG|nr:3'-phosphoadenosine 5'-phosphosulfate sulfotransferase [Mucor velutinosus]